MGRTWTCWQLETRTSTISDHVECTQTPSITNSQCSWCRVAPSIGRSTRYLRINCLVSNLIVHYCLSLLHNHLLFTYIIGAVHKRRPQKWPFLTPTILSICKRNPHPLAASVRIWPTPPPTPLRTSARINVEDAEQLKRLLIIKQIFFVQPWIWLLD